MSVRYFHPEVRLRKLLAEHGGILTADALDRADEAIENLRDAAIDVLTAKIAEMAVLSGSAEHHERCYVLANEVFSEAGMFGLNELSAAAHSLCVMLGSHADHPPPQGAVRAHTDAMRGFVGPCQPGEQETRRAVVTGLQKLSARFAV